MATRKKQHIGPSLEVDRRIRGVGRIRMASGLHVPAQFHLLNSAITELAKTDDGRSLLREVQAKRLRLDVLWSHYKSRSLHLIPLGGAAKDLRASVAAWREQTKADVSSDTYRVRKELVTRIDETAKLGALVAALPDVIRQLRVHMHGARSFNVLRAYALAFARDTMGRQSAVYQQVLSVPTRKVTALRTKRPLSPREVVRLVVSFAAVGIAWREAHPSPKATRRPFGSSSDVISMVLTGMNPKEHAGAWTVLSDRVSISGTKRPGRVRDVPKLFPCALSPCSSLLLPSVTPRVYAKQFRLAAKTAGITCTPYDLRRSFANWLESAGVPRTRRKMYLGHGAKDITDSYERHEIDDYLASDGAKVRAWIDAQLMDCT